MQHDARGNAVTLSNPRALESYERALKAFHTYTGDPLAPLDQAIAADAGFASAYVTKALILTTFMERRFMRDAAATLDAGRAAVERGTARERALAEAARRLIAGDWHAAARMLDQILVEHPRDIVALQVAHVFDFFRGDALNLRNRISRVLPSWSASLPGYAYVLGMHAFGLEECNQYPDAERAGRAAVEISGDDCWAVHAVGHVMEMQGRMDEGFAWYEQTRAVWNGAENGFAYHNAWHTALYRMDAGDYGFGLKVFDERFAAGTEMALARIDATALLWRLMLEGADVATRFAGVADDWERALADEGGFYAFNDFHATLAFAATGRAQALARVGSALARSAMAGDDNARMARDVALPASEAAIAYCQGRYYEAAQKIAAMRDGASAFGGSHAQRDLLTLTLIHAARRSGQGSLARHYASERLVHKPGSAWGHRLAAPLAGGVRRVGATMAAC
ncbi:MAG TPA: tetratricopeptide repeat protein [Burkholderiales bacterium]|nr:tetratricopeptide repeat protein [Burkholderiales bacterium]